MKRLRQLVSFLVLTIVVSSPSWSNPSTDYLLEIVRGFSEEDPELQYQARAQLADYVARQTAPGQREGAEKTTQGLVDCLKDPAVSDEAKKYILRQLGRVGTATAVEPLSEIMSGGNALQSELARQALERIPGPEASNALKRAIRQSSEDAARQTYLRSLANRKDPDNLGYFSKVLVGEDSLPAIESIHALAKLGTVEAARALQRAYRSQPTPELRLDLERALVSLPETADGVLIQIQETGLSSANRRAALTRLVESEHGQSVKLLRSSLSGSDPDLRTTALRLALTHGKENLVRLERGNYSADDWRVVLGGLSAFSGREAEDIALEAAETGNREIRIQAIRTLAAFGSGRSIDLVLRHFAGRDQGMKQAAIHTLERMQVPALNSRLQKMLNSDSESDASTVIEALVYRDIPNAKNRLFRFVNGENADLARQALRTLAIIADEEDLYRLYFVAKRTDNEDLGKMIAGMLKRVAPEVGSLEFQAKVSELPLQGSN